MCGFLLRIIINAVVLFLVIVELPGVFVDTLGGALLGVLIVGIANAAVRPILSKTARPFDLCNLGISTFLVNLLVSIMVITTLPGFRIYSMIAPVIGICLITVCSFTLSKVIQDR